VMMPVLVMLPVLEMLPLFDNVMVPVAKLLMVAVDALDKMPPPPVFDIAMSPELEMVPVLTMPVLPEFDNVMVPPALLLMVPELLLMPTPPEF